MSKLTQEQKVEILSMKAAGYSSRHIAATVLGSATKKSTVNDFVARENFDEVMEVEDAVKQPVIKIIDVETAPEIAYTFRRFKAFISPDQVIKRGYLLSYSIADLHTAEVEGKNLSDYPLFDIDHTDDWELCQDLWRILDEADVVVAHNGYKFDRAYINQRFAFHGMKPPSTYVVVDTLKAAKKQFFLPSNSLKEMGAYFETESEKLDNEGFPLWKACCEGDRDAFGRMQTYNDGDVVSLRDLYIKILAWIPQHPNLAAYYEDENRRCPRCGKDHLVPVAGKFYNTAVSTFQVLRCTSCQSLSRGRVNLRSKEKRANTVIGI